MVYISGFWSSFRVARLPYSRVERCRVVSRFISMASSMITKKTCVVTGANRGIGLEFAKQLLSKDNKVIATCRTVELAADLKELEGELLVLPLDVSDPASIQSFSEAVRDAVEHVDLLVNNAGVYGRRVDFNSVTAHDMEFCFRTNTIGPLLLTQALHRQGLLGGTRPSTVANITSKVGSVDDNKSGGGYAYRASKAALNIVNKSLSIDLADQDITCVLLHPGWVKTDMTGWSGLIDATTCVSGLLEVLQSDKPLNGHWYDYAGKEIPW